MTRALLLIVLCACGARAAKPAPPSIDVRAEIDQAEKAERARKHDIARVHYERAVAGAKDPSSISYARRHYAETLMTWGEYPLAITHLDAALAARPDDAKAWRFLAFLRHNQGDNQGAIAAFERARDLAPKDFVVRRDLAILRWKLRDRDGAKKEYQAMLALELPDRMRAAVEWALRELAKP
jgi:tetratricopeptide (TPR) repeat protein